MSDPSWRKVTELCAGYPPEFNAGALHDLVVKAWRMGFDVVKAPPDSDLHGDYIKSLNESLRQGTQNISGLQNALKTS